MVPCDIVFYILQLFQQFAGSLSCRLSAGGKFRLHIRHRLSGCVNRLLQFFQRCLRLFQLLVICSDGVGVLHLCKVRCGIREILLFYGRIFQLLFQVGDFVGGFCNGVIAFCHLLCVSLCGISQQLKSFLRACRGILNTDTKLLHCVADFVDTKSTRSGTVFQRAEEILYSISKLAIVDSVFVEGVQHIAVFVKPFLCPLCHEVISFFDRYAEIVCQCFCGTYRFVHIVSESIVQQHRIFRCRLQLIAYQLGLLIRDCYCIGSIFHAVAEVVLVHVLRDVLHFFQSISCQACRSRHLIGCLFRLCARSDHSRTDSADRSDQTADRLDAATHSIVKLVVEITHAGDRV